MVEISIDMDYLFELQRLSKSQLEGRGILDDCEMRNFDFKFQDGRILHWYGDIEEVLYVGDLEDSDMGVGEHIDADIEMSEGLNESYAISFSEYKEI